MQAQYYCLAIDPFPIESEELLKIRNRRETTLLEIEEIKIANVKTKEIGRKKYLWGTLLFKIPLQNYDYSVDSNFIPHRRHKTILIAEEAPFILELSGKNIIFFNKQKADKYARKILSHIFFNNIEDIRPVNFDVGKIKEDLHNGVFNNCWMNLVVCRGNIRSQSQVGTNITADPRFLDGTNYPKKGIGIEVTIRGRAFKIAIYEGGCIVLFKPYDDIESNIHLYFQMLQTFIPYRI